MSLPEKVVNTMYDSDALKKDDVLTTTSKELSLSSKIGVYLITITNQDNQEIAFFKGTVYRTFREWFSEDE